ncbi:hypothetical protein [Pleomorphomonas sp. NRK KF1]|uniref:hypothetical protein n=1 Tax=Pleomorphomonas sp. NRK KF1 TaxID=2943000 RepID=UPI002043D5CB|nr:hypothetical protein [Pleomorphomonas sp. NRK KF1]MCM5555094.1 hypothetical protein [Pleomorphomonas sp. NRK KF1]
MIVPTIANLNATTNAKSPMTRSGSLERSPKGHGAMLPVALEELMSWARYIAAHQLGMYVI